MKIFGILFPDGFDYDAGFIANLDKSKDSDGKFFEKSRSDPFLNWIYSLIYAPECFESACTFKIFIMQILR